MVCLLEQYLARVGFVGVDVNVAVGVVVGVVAQYNHFALAVEIEVSNKGVAIL